MRGPAAKVAYQSLLAFGFGAQLQELLLPHQIHGQGRGHLKRKRYGGIAGNIFWVITEDQRMASFVKFDQLWIGGLIANFSVLQIVHPTFEQRIIGEKFDRAERNSPNG